MKSLVKLTVNHEIREVEIENGATLLDLLREELKIKSVHRSCGEGECGACTVLLNGKAVCSCLTLAVQSQGQRVLTLEGLVKDGEPHPLLRVFSDSFAVQCGYCTPGMILTAYALLNESNTLTDEAIRKGIEGNICRCTGYVNIVRAIKTAAKLKDSSHWW